MTSEPWEPDVPDPEPNAAELKCISRLKDADIMAIDTAILAEACHKWRKTARVVGFAMSRVRFPGVPDLYFAARVRELVKQGKLVAEGNLSYMRYSEVKLAED